MIVFDGINPNSFETLFGIVTIVKSENSGYHYDVHSVTIINMPKNLHFRRFDTFGEAFNYLVKSENKVMKEVQSLLTKSYKTA